MSDLSRALALVVGRLAHDLKNPLAAVLSNLRYLASQHDEGDLRDAATESVVATERVVRILNDIVCLEDLRAQRYAMELQELDLAHLIVAAVDVVRPGWPGRSLRINCDARVPVATDEGLFRRGLINLLDHCLSRSAPASEVVIRCLVDGEERAQLFVLDQGPPFAPGRLVSFLADELPVEELPADGAYRSDCGLGLHVAGQAFRALGATIDVRGRDDGQGPGVCFALALKRSKHARSC
jgi:K+-sensing histidine kinase KdpD